MADGAQVNVVLADLPEIRALIEACVVFDNAVAQFGLDPAYIRDAYQRLHEALINVAIAASARAVIREAH